VCGVADVSHKYFEGLHSSVKSLAELAKAALTNTHNTTQLNSHEAYNQLEWNKNRMCNEKYELWR